MRRDEAILPATEGFDAIREFDSDHKLRRDPVIAWQFKSGRTQPLPLTAAGEDINYIAIEYPDGNVLDVAAKKLFNDSDDWFKWVRKGWSDSGAP